jgi:glycosyltransferase involved in cell wall biosynthesis
MGLDQLIKAMSSITRTIPDVILFIAGKGHLETRLKRQVDENGLSRHVRFLGFLSDAELPLAYRAADINVVPSIALEGFGLTAAESLASGTPSMVTNVGGLPEVVKDLSPDLVFASSDQKALADGLICALRGELHLPDSERCQAYASIRFNRSFAASRTAAVYRELVP